MNFSTSQNEGTGEKRRHSRKTCDKNTFFASRSRLYEGLVRNISFGGVFVESAKAFSEGEVLTLAVPCASNDQGLKLKEPFNDEDLKIKGKVIWKNQDGFGMEFIKPE